MDRQELDHLRTRIREQGLPGAVSLPGGSVANVARNVSAFCGGDASQIKLVSVCGSLWRQAVKWVKDCSVRDHTHELSHSDLIGNTHTHGCLTGHV